MALLLDATIWVSAGLADDPDQAACDALISSHEYLGALDLTLFEIANALGVKRGEPEKASRMCAVTISRCRERLIRVDPELIAAALPIASEHRLTAYDAAYVAVAQRKGWTLVSTDIRDLVSKGLAVAPDAAV